MFDKSARFYDAIYAKQYDPPARRRGPWTSWVSTAGRAAACSTPPAAPGRSSLPYLR